VRKGEKKTSCHCCPNDVLSVFFFFSSFSLVLYPEFGKYETKEMVGIVSLSPGSPGAQRGGRGEMSQKSTPERERGEIHSREMNR